MTASPETGRAAGKIFVFAKALSAPLEALWPLLAFLFCKELGATPFQVTLLVAMKPLSALLSFYGSLLLLERRDRLKPYLAGVTLFGILPCFLFPFIDNLWFLIAAQGCFWFSSRALILAWGEIFKINLTPKERGKFFSRGSSLHSLVHIAVPLLISPWFDWYPGSWKWVFFLLALLQASHLFLVVRLPIPKEKVQKISPRPSLFLPWKEGFRLLKERKDFRHYQMVFFLCGAGLIVMHPVLPFFYKETLNLSYTGVTIATSLIKGVFFALSSRSWATLFTTVPIERFNMRVTGLAAAFSLLLLLSPHIPFGLWAAYALYGAMQAGSEMSWNLSGPHFAKEGESTLFSGVNVVFVGIRGLIVPFVGQLLFVSGSTSLVFAFGGLLCLASTLLSSYPLRERSLEEVR
jgi:MFS family permease